MLLALPFQFSWAMAAVYCQHEQGPTVQHFGHHTHQHQEAEPSGHKGQLSQVHQDCGYCHAISPVSFFVPAATPVPQAAAVKMLPYAIAFSSYISDGPRRPDRHPVA